MGDAHTLWSPLSKKERSKTYTTAFRPATNLSGTNVATWLPSSEYDTMSRYFYRLTHERSALAKRVLARAEQYMPIVQDAVRRRRLPPEISCLPLIESAFEPQAVSPAGAAGLWQLMPATARRYGLTVSGSVDERFDVLKSTEAATRYLAELYQIFGDWPLALAAYNCGEGAMENALGKSGCSDLESLTRFCRQAEASPLKEETLRFVPQFAAAVLIMNQAGMLGSSSDTLSNPLASPSISRRAVIPNRLTLSGTYHGGETVITTPPRSTRLQ
jgi:membrane-bound lytic murein transglycosylase D